MLFYWRVSHLIEFAILIALHPFQYEWEVSNVSYFHK